MNVLIYSIGVLVCLGCWRLFGVVDNSREKRANDAAERSAKRFGHKPVRNVQHSLVALNVAILVAIICGWTILFWQVFEKSPSIVALGKSVFPIAIGAIFGSYFLTLLIVTVKRS